MLNVNNYYGVIQHGYGRGAGLGEIPNSYKGY